MQFAVAGHQMRSLDVHKGVAERSPSGRVMSQVDKPCYRWVDGCLWLWNHMESYGIIWNVLYLCNEMVAICCNGVNHALRICFPHFSSIPHHCEHYALQPLKRAPMIS